MNGAQLWGAIGGGLFVVFFFSLIAVALITAPLCRILNSAWHRTIMEEFRVIAWSPQRRYLRFLFWRQSWNYLLILFMGACIFSLGFWDFKFMKPTVNPIALFFFIYSYLLFGCIGIGSGLLCLSLQKTALSYTWKVSFVHIICSIFFSFPLYVSMIFGLNQWKISPFFGIILGLLPILFAFLYFLISLVLFYFRLAKVDDLLGEGIGLLEGKSA